MGLGDVMTRTCNWIRNDYTKKINEVKYCKLIKGYGMT